MNFRSAVEWLLKRRLLITAVHFFIHIVVAVILYVVITLAAYGIWDFTEWLASVGAPYDIVATSHIVGYVLYGIDIVGFGWVSLIALRKLIMDVWAARNGDW